MKTENQKLIKFNGKELFFLSIGGIYWIAIKPICEALEVNYNRQFQNIKNDKILGAAFATQQMQVGNDQSRNWACLPEFFVYGWLFKMKSESPILEEYQWKCYELLYNHFHGAIAERQNILKEKTQADIEIEQLEEILKENPTYKRIQELKKNKKVSNSGLRKLDNNYIQDQLEIWTQDLKAKYPV